MIEIMVHLIDEETLVAEIERLRERAHDLYGYSQFDTAYNKVLELIDTVEVKDVDIEKEVIDWWNAHYSSKTYTFEGYAGHYVENSTLIDIAKHFFELDIKAAQKGE